MVRPEADGDRDSQGPARLQGSANLGALGGKVQRRAGMTAISRPPFPFNGLERIGDPVGMIGVFVLKSKEGQEPSCF
jgi:hypothetical protein